MKSALHPDKKQAGLRRGFTLIEIMIVVAIIGMCVGAFVPVIFQGKKEALRKAASDIEEVCKSARQQAIIHGKKVEMHISPQGRRVSSGNSSATWPESLVLEMADVSLVEYKDAEDARVIFYPNGISDEMTIVLLNPDKNERRKISLEPMTALANVQTIGQ